MWIVFNPTAGAARRRRLERAAALLPSARIVETGAPGDATRLAAGAAAEGARVVVAAGGDGTIAEVAAGLAGSGAALGILPFGTANVLARELGLPLDAEGAARVIATGRRGMLRPGLARDAAGNARLFVQMLGVGLDAAVVHALPPGLKRRLGALAYVVQTLRLLPRHPFAPLRLRADGGPWEECVALLAMKGRLYAGPFVVAPEARAGMEGFILVLQRRGGAGAALLAGAALPLGLLPRLPFIERRACRALEVEGAGLLAQADGDAAPAPPLRLSDAPAPLPVLLPR
ncbi:diacylglycerol/lipid kinase family protein [Rubritepida flocculans]|uniref:diacylglycerol/lipid kinase family protein n=1 Tax=Rubritepida flocculans TaxID=182403 RepID=UPI0004160277|nr:diacylglycerol kinase family protein [Rubritepida flocculans]